MLRRPTARADGVAVARLEIGPTHSPGRVQVVAGTFSSEGATMTARPPTMHAAPTARGTTSPYRTFFSMKKTAAMTAIQAIFIKPITASTPISAQQHPRHHRPWDAPARTAPGTPRPKSWVMTKPSGDRHARRHAFFKGVN